MIGKIHDENQDVRILSRKFRVNQGQKAIHVSHDKQIGNKTWGKIDYLCHYCGYHLIWGENAVIDKNDYESSEKKKEFKAVKKAAKERKIKTAETNKRK